MLLRGTQWVASSIFKSSVEDSGGASRHVPYGSFKHPKEHRVCCGRRPRGPTSCISFLIEAISHFTILREAEFLWQWVKPPQTVLLDKAFVLQQIQTLVKSNSFQIMNGKCRYTGGCSFGCVGLIHPLGFPGGASGKEPTCQCRKHETWVRSLGREDLLEKGTTTHSSIPAWRIPWIEEPGGLQSTGSHRLGHDWATKHVYKAERVWGGMMWDSCLSRESAVHRTFQENGNVFLHCSICGRQPQVLMEHLKCGECHWGIEFYILLKFNVLK